MSKVIHLSEDSFHEVIQNNKGNFVIDFWAPWCGPCRSLGKTLDAISIENDDITIYKIDIDECPSLATEYQVSSIPTMLFFKNGTLIDQTVGVLTRYDILEKFN